MISKIKFKNHYLLNDLELDFTNDNGQIYNTIVLAGDNGSGKTTILNLLSEFLNLGSFEYFDFIEYKIGKRKFKIFHSDKENISSSGFHNRYSYDNNSVVYIGNNKYNNPSVIDDDFDDIRHYGFAYSRARTGFETQKITSSKTEQIDSNIRELDASGNNDFTSIKQLIVDIDSQDNSDWMDITRSNKPIKYDTFKLKSRMYRFTNAFNNFFDNIKFYKVDNANPTEKKILFRKNNSIIEIDDLSTGEKQIVFRGTYLLKNVNGISNGIVLIDEPELSLHPKWQEKILEYYRKMFRRQGVQNVQIIIATHSEYLIKAALEDKENILIISLHDDNGVIGTNKILSPYVLPTCTSAEINYFTFGVISNDYHNQLYGYLQNKYQLDSITKMDRFILGKVEFLNDDLLIESSFRNQRYHTLTTFIRNKIDHPDFNNSSFSNKQLAMSIELLVKLCKL